MQSVLLTIHLIACLALIVAVMLQRSEGGALGMGGGGTGGLISGRGAAGVLVKATMGLAAVFFITSVTMTRLNNESASAPTALERGAEESANPFDTLNTPPSTPAPVDPLGGTTATPPASNTAPTTAPATPAPTTTPDPLAPSTNAAPAQPAPATTQPTAPAPTPENSGSPN